MYFNCEVFMDIICHPVVCGCWVHLQATWLSNCYLLRNLAIIKNDLPGRESVLLILFMRLSSKLEGCVYVAANPPWHSIFSRTLLLSSSKEVLQSFRALASGRWGTSWTQEPYFCSATNILLPSWCQVQANFLSFQQLWDKVKLVRFAWIQSWQELTPPSVSLFSWWISFSGVV